MQYYTLPYLGGRHYVHSSTFVNSILDLFPALNNASFYFTKISQGSYYTLNLSSTQIEGNVHGVVDGIYFAFTNTDVDIDIPKVAPEPKTISIDNLNRSEFIWNSVAHFKQSYEDDHAEGQPVIAKIELKNFNSIQWPAKFQFSRRYTPTRTSCSFTYNGVEICKQIGMIR